MLHTFFTQCYGIRLKQEELFTIFRIGYFFHTKAFLNSRALVPCELRYDSGCNPN